MASLKINSASYEVEPDERLVDAINRIGMKLPQVCYHPQLGPIQTCDTCIVEVNGKLARACGTIIEDGMSVLTASSRASAAQREAFDRILENHLLYCTVCDNNNGNCTVHNTTGLLKVEHQSIPYRTKPYEVDRTNPFYRYDPNQCILCGRCVEACQNLQVNETLSIRWEDPHPRVLWDGGKPIGESSFLRAFAKKAGYKIVGVWKGIASGAKQERAERKKVLALAQARKVDVILVTELTSWGRSVLGRDSAGHPLP